VKIVKVIACVIVFGVLGAGIGIPVAFIAFETGAFDSTGGGAGFEAILWIFVSMSVFGILGAALGADENENRLEPAILWHGKDK